MNRRKFPALIAATPVATSGTVSRYAWGTWEYRDGAPVLPTEPFSGGAGIIHIDETGAHIIKDGKVS